MIGLKNKKGSVLFSILVAVTIFMMGMLILNIMRDDIDTMRTGMDCNNLSISDGAKVVCLGSDGLAPYFIFLILSAAGGIIAEKFLI